MLHVKRNTFKSAIAYMLMAVLTIPLFYFKTSAATVETSWIEQFGPVAPNVLSSVEVDGDIYVAGTITNAALPGQTSYGFEDVFVRKYDANGTEQWTRQFGTERNDFSQGMATDGTNVYVIGNTSSVLPGQTSPGGADFFIRKYDANGTEQWTRQFGSSGSEVAWGGAADATGVYVGGSTRGSFTGYTNQGGYDAVVVKYDFDGNSQWTRQFGTDSQFDDVYAIYADNNGVYVGGSTGYDTTQALGSSNLGGGDAYLRKYDANGTHQWTEQFGTSDYEQVFGISSDSSGVYVSGETYEALPGETNNGNGDVFVAKYDISGTQQWIDQFGTAAFDTSYGLSADSTGVYVSGYTGAALPGQTHLGGDDAFVQKYNSNGEVIWTYQYGTAQDDQGYRIDADGNGVVVTGRTLGALPGQTSSGATDLFILRLGQDDFDSDSIFDTVDPSPLTYSNNYNDGTTTGTITTRGDQTLTIEDATNPSEGVLMSAAVGGGPTAASIDSCSGTVTTNLDAGDSATVTCGSAIVRVESGAVEAIFTADDGTVATTTLDSGNEVIFKPEDTTVTAKETNVSPVVVVVNGASVAVDPGEVQEVFKAVVIDIKPGSSSNTINLNGNGVIPVAILTTDSFNAAVVDPFSVALEGASVRVKGNSGNAGNLQDIDADGDLDLVVHIENDLQLVEGASVAKLTGLTYDGIPIGGSDFVQIVP